MWDLFIWEEKKEGGEVRPLTHTSVPEGNPMYWIRKNVFVCSIQIPGEYSSIAVIDHTGAVTQKIQDPQGNLGWPQPSPWDDRILAVREDPATGWTAPGIICLPDPTFTPFPATDCPGGQMAWIDANRIFLSRVKNGNFLLVEKNLQTNEEKTILEDGRNWLSASNPSGGGPFFFTRRLGQKSSIFQLLEDPQAPSGWICQDFSQAQIYDWQPSVSPNGQEVVFQSLRGGKFKVLSRNIKTGTETEIPLTGFEEIFHPSWIQAHPGRQ